MLQHTAYNKAAPPCICGIMCSSWNYTMFIDICAQAVKPQLVSCQQCCKAGEQQAQPQQN